MHRFEQYLKILQLYHENSRFSPSFKFWSVSAIQKHLRRSEKMHPARILRPKSTFLTIPILVAGTNSVSSGNIVDESFFDKYFAEKLKVPTIFIRGFHKLFSYLSSRGSIGITQKIYYFVKLLLLDIALFE